MNGSLSCVPSRHFHLLIITSLFTSTRPRPSITRSTLSHHHTTRITPTSPAPTNHSSTPIPNHLLQSFITHPSSITSHLSTVIMSTTSTSSPSPKELSASDAAYLIQCLQQDSSSMVVSSSQNESGVPSHFPLRTPQIAILRSGSIFFRSCDGQQDCVRSPCRLIVYCHDVLGQVSVACMCCRTGRMPRNQDMTWHDKTSSAPHNHLRPQLPPPKFNHNPSTKKNTTLIQPGLPPSRVPIAQRTRCRTRHVHKTPQRHLPHQWVPQEIRTEHCLYQWLRFRCWRHSRERRGKGRDRTGGEESWHESEGEREDGDGNEVGG